jgi:hypothetical protein
VRPQAKCQSIRAAGDQLRSTSNSHRHASESWHPAFVAAHADMKLDPSFRWGDGTWLDL